MRRYVLSPDADHDIDAILALSHKQFGEAARQRYETLLFRAIRDLAIDSDRPGSQAREELAPNARTYHLKNSRDSVEPARDRVRQPRHFILFRTLEDGRIEIGRVLHDSMDLARHLPEEYRPT